MILPLLTACTLQFALPGDSTAAADTGTDSAVDTGADTGADTDSAPDSAPLDSADTAGSGDSGFDSAIPPWGWSAGTTEALVGIGYLVSAPHLADVDDNGQTDLVFGGTRVSTNFGTYSFVQVSLRALQVGGSLRALNVGWSNSGQGAPSADLGLALVRDAAGSTPVEALGSEAYSIGYPADLSVAHDNNWQEVLGPAGAGRLAAVDFDGDGADELIAGCGGAALDVFRAEAAVYSSTASALTTGVCTDFCVGDFDGNGVWDLAAAGTSAYPDAAIEVLPNLSVSLAATGARWPVEGATTGLRVDQILALDSNGDGRDELAAQLDGELRLYSFDGAAWTETIVEGRGGLDHFAVGDLNGDGLDDLAVLRLGSPTSAAVYYGSAAGLRFGEDIELGATPPGFPSHNDTLAIGDLDGDGCGDLVAAWMVLEPVIVYGTCD